MDTGDLRRMTDNYPNTTPKPEYEATGKGGPAPWSWSFPDR